MTNAQEQKKQERQARRRLIQEAAREIFATKGYAKTSIEQVAQRASLSVGAIYLYFRSKEDLYISLIEAPLLTLASEVNELCKNREERTPLRAAWARMVAWASADPESAVILRSLAQPEIRTRLSSEVVEAVSEGLRQTDQALQNAVTTGVELGLYRPVASSATAQLVWSLFLGVVQSAHARQAVDLVGPAVNDSADWAFDVIESTMRIERARVAEAA